MRCARILVSGLVQGVSYRSFTYKHAKELGLKGFVRNLPDGRVEILAEGEEKTIQNLITKLKQGPSGASVENMTISWENYEGLHDSFEILHS